VDPVPDPLLFFSGSAGNRTRASGSVAKILIYIPCALRLNLPADVAADVKLPAAEEPGALDV
jgi:hypothetical protein